MADILAFPEKTDPRPARPPEAGTAEIVLFPGVRIERREEFLDLSRRPGRSGRSGRDKAS